MPSESLGKRESVQWMPEAGLPVVVLRTWQVTGGFWGVDMREAIEASLVVAVGFSGVLLVGVMGGRCGVVVIIYCSCVCGAILWVLSSSPQFC